MLHYHHGQHDIVRRISWAASIDSHRIRVNFFLLLLDNMVIAIEMRTEERGICISVNTQADRHVEAFERHVCRPPLNQWPL